MRWYVLGIIFLTHLFSTLSAQKPVPLQVLQLFQGRQVKSYPVFNSSTDSKEELTSLVKGAKSFSIRQDVFHELITEDQGLIHLRLAEPSDIVLDLYRTDIYSYGAKIKTSDGREFSPNPDIKFYRGMVQGNVNSLAIMTIAEDKIFIVVSDEAGNRRIQPTTDGSYISFLDTDLLLPKNIDCYTDESAIQNPGHFPEDQRNMTGNCVEIYVEADFKSYQDNGSNVATTEAWVGTLWNEVITLYDNENIPVSVSDVLVYTSSDPFAGLASTSAILSAFATHIDTLVYDGRLAHLLSTRPLGGGIAYIDVLCSNSVPCAFSSSLSTSIVPVPTYSWNVEVVTHEMGHNMGSSHTHACVWNGNNTQIDDCGNQWAANNGSTPEGATCYNPNAPILPISGTIMSYCHLIGGIGINFNNGFGTQPGNLIRSRYNNASCNTGTCSPPTCTSITDPAPFAINVDISNNISWSSVPGATGYKITIGTTPSNGSIVNNLNVGLVTTYDPANAFPFSTLLYVKIVPYNELGDAVSCSNQSFTTEANVAPQCTAMNQPANGATGVSVDVVIRWPHSVGNQTGYYISIGTSLNGTNIVNHLDVGNNNFYDHASSYPYATQLFVKISPYNGNGEITTCASQSFTTFVPVAGDFCTSAIELPCGSSITGTTTGALPDSGMPFCVTSIDAPGMWYKFTGNGLNAVIFTCTQYNFDTKLNAYSGSCGNLTCVTGIDDFCQQGSQISFPTTNGTTYYILVQGWQGAQGNYTLTRTCYSGPFYCQSSGYFATYEWIKTVAIGPFSKTSGPTSYSDFMNDSIMLSRGASYAITLTPMFLQGTRTEYYKVWADLNQDGDFIDSQEELFSAGPSTTAVTGNIAIPITATAGATRLRVTMSHEAITSSCNTFNNGEVEDYKLKIKCNLVTSVDDSGNGSLRNVSICADDGENILFAPSLDNQTINVTTGPITVDGIWKWMPAAGTNIKIKAGPGVTRILSVPAGKSAEIQYLNFIGGTSPLGSAIENFGSLILRSCEIHPAIGSTNPPLRNAGTTQILGVTNVKF